MKEEFSQKQNHIIWTALRNVGYLMDRVRTKELSKYGLSTSQAGMLHHVKALGERATPAAIARIQHREATSVSSILIRMEKLGLVKRTKDMARKNQVRVYLTDKGEDALNDAARRESIDRVMSRMSAENRRHMLKATEELRRIVIEELADVHRDSYLDNFRV